MKKFQIKKRRYDLRIVSAFLFTFTAYADAPLVHDNLVPFEPEATSKPVEYQRYANPRLVFRNANAKTALWIRRDIVQVENFTVQFSTTGKTKAQVDGSNFRNVKGRSGGTNLPAGQTFGVDSKWNVTQGINLRNASTFAEISATIYQPFPEAASKYKKMGFTDQFFFNSVDGDTQGAVLKTAHSPTSAGEIVVVFRGTEPTSFKDWIAKDANFFQVPIDGGKSPDAVMPQVHRGFYNGMQEALPFVLEHIPSTLENRLRRQLIRYANDGVDLNREFGVPGKLKNGVFAFAEPIQPYDPRQVHITGHSLGAAIATLTVAELLFAHRDPPALGYYFADYNMRQMSDANINKFIAYVKQKDADYVNPQGLGLKRRTFSVNEEDNIAQNAGLAYQPIFYNEEDPANRSADFKKPTEVNETIVADRRFKNLTTFGSPRAGDWIFKYLIERYAERAYASLTRYENVHVVKTRNETDQEFFGDVVTRVPLALAERGVARIIDNFFPMYSHVGIRVYFDSNEDQVNGDFRILKCEYTNKSREDGLRFGNIMGLLGEVKRHGMDIYSGRVRSYLVQAAAQQGDSPLPQGHPCRNLIQPGNRVYSPIEFNIPGRWSNI